MVMDVFQNGQQNVKENIHRSVHDNKEENRLHFSSFRAFPFNHLCSNLHFIYSTGFRHSPNV